MIRPASLRIGNPWIWAHVVLIVIAVVLQFVPLTRELHYEFSAAIAVCISLVAALASLVVWWREPSADSEPSTLRAMAMSLVASVPPLVVALTHSVASGFCGIVDGMLWYAVLVLPSALIAVVVARLAATMSSRRVVQVVALFALWAAPLLRGAYEALTGPHIFFYGWQAGFFPGGSWDPELTITPLLLIYRAAHIAIAFLLLAVAFEIDRVRRGQPHRIARVALPAAAVAAFALALVPLRAEIGLTRTDRYLRDVLGDSLRTRYATIYYHAPSTDSLDIWRTANWTDYYVARHAAAAGLNADSVAPITLYVFSSASEQKRLVGTSSASFTKPWLRTISIAFDRVESTLEHELAHIVLQPYGNTLGVSWSNGILEGSAVAFEYADDPATLHRHARAAYDFGLAPPVIQIMSPAGFASKRASLSYMLAGSFCRWLIDTYGAPRFTAFYASGSFDDHYERSSDQLEHEYQTFLKTFPETDSLSVTTIKYLYGGGSFFLQRCLRRLATLTGDGYRALAEERYDDALGHFRASLDEGISSGARAGIIRALHDAGRFEELLDSTAVYRRDTSSYWLLPYNIEVYDALSVRHPDNGSANDALLEILLATGPDEATQLRAALRIVLETGYDPQMQAYFTRPMSQTSRLLLLEAEEHESVAHVVAKSERNAMLELMGLALVVRSMPLVAASSSVDIDTQAVDVALVADPDTARARALASFVHCALRRTLLDASLYRAGADGTLDRDDRALLDPLIDEAYRIIAPKPKHLKTSVELIRPERSLNEMRAFVDYMSRNGVIVPHRSRR